MLRRALIVGGGPAGMVAAISLSRVGVSCEIVEIETNWSPAGVGLGLQSPPLRALKSLDLLDDVTSVGWRHDEVEMRTPTGELVTQAPMFNVNDVAVPPFLTLSRIALHQVLERRLRALDTRVRTGLTFTRMSEETDGVQVDFSDGSAGVYDLVVGADGMHSQVRRHILPDAISPQPTGQVIWRIEARRPEALRRYTIMVDRATRIGLVPLSEESIYLWMLDSTSPLERPPRDELLEHFTARLQPYAGVVPEIAKQITEPEQVDFRVLLTMILPLPWNAGRMLIVGDAAHTTTPQLAFGVGLAIEDAVVLGELVGDGHTGDTLGQCLAERRYERCRLVVENSLQLGRWEQEPDTPGADPIGLMGASIKALAAPIWHHRARGNTRFGMQRCLLN